MLFSIIVPVYKVEVYLEECILSVLNQTCEDWEMILVDDGSPDECPVICDKYAGEYKNISVIHKKNGGLSSARNRGIEKSTGEYIVFLDSDDVLLPNALKNISGALKKKPDVLITEMYNTSDVHAQIVNHEKYIKPEQTDKKSVIHFVFAKEDLTWPAQQYIVKRAFICERELKFEEGFYHEDVDWTSRLFLNAETFSFFPYIWYVRRFEREGSITTVPNPKRTKDVITLVAKQENEPKYNLLSKMEKHEIFNQLGRALLSCLVNIYKYEQNERDIIYKLLDNNYSMLKYCKLLRHKVFYILIATIGAKNAIKISMIIRKYCR